MSAAHPGCTHTTQTEPSPNPVGLTMGQPTDQLIEPEEAALRRRLGLRPVHYFNRKGPGTHPDQRPCPPWCWIGQEDGAEHEVEPRQPTRATHSMGVDVEVMASAYQGTMSFGGNYVSTAAVSLHLQQIGQGAPTIRVDLRRWRDGEHEYDSLLVLAVTDAAEVARALAYLVDVAEGMPSGPTIEAAEAAL